MKSTKHIARYYNTLPLHYYVLPHLRKKASSDHLKNKIKQIDVLIITHTYGYPEDIDEIKKVTGDMLLIEDCSHSFLSKYKDQYTGTLGDAAIFSTGFTKFPPVGIGGFCVVNRPDKFPLIESEYHKIPKTPPALSMKDFIKAIVLYFLMRPLIYRIITRNASKWLDAGIDLGTQVTFFESKGNAWAYRIFRNNITFYEKMLTRQSVNAKILAESINLKCPALNIENSIPNYYMFPILIEERDDLFNRLVKNKIEAAKHWHKSLEWASNYGYIRGECPKCERLVDMILTLPTHYGVRKKDLNRIATTINENRRTS